jgi:hypothetical protein
MKFYDGFIIVRCQAAVNQGDAVQEEKTSNAMNPLLNVERGGAGRVTRAVIAAYGNLPTATRLRDTRILRCGTARSGRPAC